MHLYEIKAMSFAHQLNEVGTADIDADLERTAGEIGQTSKLGQGDETQAGLGDAGQFGQAPNPAAGESPLQGAEEDPLAADDPLGAGETDEEADENLMKKVDSILVSAVKGHDYAQNYRHEDNSKIHPYNILSMDISELQNLRTMARNKAGIETFNGDLGTYDNPEIKFFQDLVSYVDKVIDVKKSATKEYKDKKDGKTAKYDTKEEPKIKKGDKPKAKQEK